MSTDAFWISQRPSPFPTVEDRILGREGITSRPYIDDITIYTIGTLEDYI